MNNSQKDKSKVQFDSKNDPNVKTTAAKDAVDPKVSTFSTKNTADSKGAPESQKRKNI